MSPDVIPCMKQGMEIALWILPHKAVFHAELKHGCRCQNFRNQGISRVPMIGAYQPNS